MSDPHEPEGSASDAAGRRELSKAYEPHEVEDRWIAAWAEARLFVADPSAEGTPYSIVIPPPNVTGVLHMGHALNNTLQDVLVRQRRMDGDNVLWVVGTDHAGIATQNVVEKQLAAQGSSRDALGREAFVERVWEWKARSGGQILEQLRRLGASCDFSRERFTMDEGLSRAVREVFVALWEQGLVYRGDSIHHWCPRCRTALSDLEVEHEERDGNLWHLRYPTPEGDAAVIVATTRPETMLGDTAVAVHPDDERYRALVGRSLVLPLVGRLVPVVADGAVVSEFGTGAVKVTPAHDATDFEIGRRHGLASPVVIGPDAHTTEQAGAYAGLDRFEARARIVADLERSGALVRTEPYRGSVGLCYRCRTVVEPRVSMQWFVRTAPLAAPAIAAVREGRTRIVPAHWAKTYFEWMENIRDWCVSRQIWWGHRIPAWYCDACAEVIVARVDPTACPSCGSPELRRETDVLDTWFSSALWPFSTLGWPERTPELARWYPTTVLVTGFDILFFWVARMMMMGLRFMDDVPFRDVYIHALVRDAQGQKMSKSKGNVVDPLAVMGTYGTDAFRFALVAFAAQGRDVRLDEKRIEGYRHFCNKLWNVARFSLMHLDPAAAGARPEAELPPSSELPLPDRWILARLAGTIAEVRDALASYRFNEAASRLYAFTWLELCDWWIELTKADLRPEAAAPRRAVAQSVLADVLSNVVRLLHPFMPFITEELWAALPGTEGMVARAPYPRVDPARADARAETEMQELVDVVTRARDLRTQLGIAPREPAEVWVATHDDAARARFEGVRALVLRVVPISALTIATEIERPAGAMTAVAGRFTVHVRFGDQADVAAIRAGLERELERARTDRDHHARKLENESFLAKAPPELVEKARAGRDDAERTAARVAETLALLGELGAGTR